MTKQTTYSLDEIAEMLRAAGASEEMIESATEKAAESKIVSAANDRLVAKCVENVSIDRVRRVFFRMAEIAEETIVLTSADGKNRNTSVDRHMIEVPVPQGRLVVHLYLDN